MDNWLWTSVVLQRMKRPILTIVQDSLLHNFKLGAAVEDERIVSEVITGLQLMILTYILAIISLLLAS